MRPDIDPTRDLRYDVHVNVVNAADYGVPQWRERVFIVAFRSDLTLHWSEPQPTHSIEALLWEQWRSQEYWRRHGIQRKRPGKVSRRFDQGIRMLEGIVVRPPGQAWRTVRDALSGLPRLRRSQRVEALDNHYLNPGARSYTGHCGSLLDEPAKTLKAGSHGVPGGENCLALGGDRIRYFSVRECARIQTFPDDYRFSGPWIRKMRQVGNAVPVLLAQVMASAIRQSLLSKVSTSTERIARVTAFRGSLRSG